MSEVVNVWGGECLGGERLTIRKNDMFEFARSGRRALRLVSVLSRWLSLRGRGFYHLLVGYHIL